MGPMEGDDVGGIHNTIVWQPHATLLARPRYATVDTTKIFLWYADGGPAPSEGPPCGGKNPPAFSCGYGESVDDCKRQVQTHLDEWYADFNVVFTFTKPTSGPYYTVIITSSGGWCDQANVIGGVAPINCRDLEGGTAYAFQCGRSAKTCAAIIAQEQGHTVGLAHTASRADVMYPAVQPVSEGFENKQNVVSGTLCRTNQNSYDLMAERLGLWNGGPKPSPFGEGTIPPVEPASPVVETEAAATPALEDGAEASADLDVPEGGCTIGAGRPAGGALLTSLGLLLVIALVRSAARRRGR